MTWRSPNFRNRRSVEEQGIANLRSLLAKILPEDDLWRLPACERGGNVIRGGLQLVCQCKRVSGGLRRARGGMGGRGIAAASPTMRTRPRTIWSEARSRMA